MVNTQRCFAVLDLRPTFPNFACRYASSTIFIHLLLSVTRLATSLLQIIDFYLQLQIPTVVGKYFRLHFFHVGFLRHSQERNLKGSDQKMGVCAFSCCSNRDFSIYYASVFSLAVLSRSDNSRLCFLFFLFLTQTGLYS